MADTPKRQDPTTSTEPASRDLLRQIVENIPIRVFWKDTESRYLGCNTAFARDAGLSHPDELIGKSDFDLVWREQAELYRTDDKRVMEATEPKLNYEEPQTSADGKTVWLRTSKVALRNAQSTAIGMLGIYDDITEHKQAEIALHNANRALRAISACNEAMFRSQTEEDLLNAVCTLIVEIGEYRMAWIGYTENDPEKSVKPMARYGHEAGYLDNRKFSWDGNSEFGRGPTGTAIRTGVTQVNQNFAANPNFSPWHEAALKRGYQSSIALPMISTAGISGALMIYAKEPDAFNVEEVKLLEELAKDLVFGIETLNTRIERDRVAIDNQRQAATLQKSLEDFIKAIASTVETRDPYTAGHQQRTSQLAVDIAREMGLPEDAIHGLAMAAIVHDLGKISVPAEILAKPGRLSDMEMMLIKVHPQTGYNILKDIQFPWPIATIVWQHHERMDGSGYPQGLKGDDILLESRIMAIADVVEAMASHRPYRPSRGVAIALEELERGRGTAYDANVVDACLKMFREKNYVLPDSQNAG